MKTLFKSEYNEHDAFYARGDLLRPNFGQWDAYDPVSNAILDVVEAQTELADTFDDDATYGIATEVGFTAVIKKRYAAIRKLLAAAEDRESWPDPKLGLRD